ncbi:MAG: hypothetical protein KA436_00260 [Oligoflexales bacterium]|nr:hypothetical protein [Oligoflexales bacterium]
MKKWKARITFLVFLLIVILSLSYLDEFLSFEKEQKKKDGPEIFVMP